MSLSSALNSAMSGLRVASRTSEIISSNIANASTEGYGRRSLETTANLYPFNSGVRVTGVTRHVDAQILNDRRLADAEYGYISQTTAFLTQLEDTIGTPESAGSLSARLSDFNASLVTASSRPDATDRLDSAALAARDLAESLRNSSKQVQESRSRADAQIAVQVERLKDALNGVRDINSQITAMDVQGRDTSPLQDQRQVLIDEISEIAPVRVMQRDHGAVAIYSTGGAVLLEGTVADIEFNRSNVVTPYMSVQDGTLSGLTINGYSVSTSSETGKLRGGTLGAQFEIRDESGVRAQQQLDAIARNLVERFQDPAVDPTLNAGDPGLFTDRGSAFDPLDEQGLSDRIELNTLVDPAGADETWRLRDGLGAAAPGDVGEASLLNALADTITNQRTPASGDFGGGDFSMLDLVSTYGSQLGLERLRADNQMSFASAQRNELRQLELADGVDTDLEIQRLLVVEQAYAANARIVQAVDEMMDTLLRVT